MDQYWQSAGLEKLPAVAEAEAEYELMSARYRELVKYVPTAALEQRMEQRVAAEEEESRSIMGMRQDLVFLT